MMKFDEPSWTGPSRWSRILGEGENPLLWSLPIYRAWGISVRIHVIFVAIILVKMILSIPENTLGPGFVALALIALFVLVLLHEYGHCFACRRVGGEADEILLWPLGGLASCLPPNRWQAHLVTVVGGPAVNLLLVPVLGGAVLAMGGSWDLVVFNPFDFGSAGSEALAGGYGFWFVWSLHATNAVLLGFNVLVPMYPLDGGRILHAVLWGRRGKLAADRISVAVGLVSAVLLGTVGLLTGETLIFGIAIFGGFVCYQEQRRQRFLEEPGADWPIPEVGDDPSGPDDGVEEEEIDAILAKISREGIKSL
ncbi:MAG TPA: hypothetical protein ENJ00_03610, partial [Phycisphaerales bacterium]|nr:hypothetical protein [Phycisphaerales bacterium]